MPVRLRILGGFGLYRDDELIEISSAKQRCVLAWLALAIPNRCKRDTLAEQLWGWENDGKSKQSLRTALTELRKLLRPEQVLGADLEDVWLDPQLIEVDALEFNASVAAADPQSLERASRLYQGDLLDGLRVREGDIERWISDQREGYRATALGVFVKLSVGALQRGEVEGAIAYARRSLVIDDFAEEAHRALLNAFIAGNRRGDAMRHAASLLDLFERSLAVAPSLETMALIDQIRGSTAARESPSALPRADADQAPVSAPRAAGVRPLIERRSVVALAYEIDGLADAIGGESDPERVARLVADLTGIVRANAGEWFGVPASIAPDRGVIFFGIVGNTEDQVSDAVAAAVDLSGAVTDFRWQEDPGRRFGIRIGIDSAVSLISDADHADGRSIVTSRAEITARTICDLAANSTILVAEGLREQISSYFKVTPHSSNGSGKGPPPLWQVLGPNRSQDRFQATRRRTLPIVGRRGELDLLMGRWADAGGGKGQFVLLRGEPGIGKSRLLHDLRRRLKAASVSTWTLQCNPGDRVTPFSPLVNLFARPRIPGGRTDALFQRAMRRLGLSDAVAIDTLQVALAMVMPSEPVSALSVRDALRRTRAAVEAVIAARLRSGPTCIVLEDLHWADPSTVAELQSLVRWIADRPVLLVASTRETAAHPLSSESNAMDLVVRRLSRDDARALATGLWESVANERADPSEITAIIDFADGIPLFVEELVLWRYRSGKSLGPSPALGGGSWTEPSMPLNDLLLSRLATLGRGREVAQIAAVIGRSFDFAALREAVGDLLSPESLGSVVDLLVEHSVLRQIWPPPTPEFEFRHALLREAAYGSLRDDDRLLLHRRIFNRLEREAGSGAVVKTADLAWHAERSGDFRAAATILARVGRDSATRSAMAEAGTSLRRALNLTEGIDEIETRQRLQLQVIAALGPVVTSQHGPRDNQAIQLYERGVNIARQRSVRERSEWFSIFWGWWYTGADFRTQRDRVARIQDMLTGVNDPEAALQLNHMVWALNFNLGKHAEALRAVDSGLALYDPDRATASRALFGGHDAKVCGLGERALSLWLMGSTEASDRALAEMIALVESIAHLPSRAHAFDTEAVSAFYRHDFDRLAETSASMAKFAEKYELESLVGLSDLFGGWAEAFRSDLASGHAKFLAGLGILRRLGSVADLPLYLDMHAELLSRAGQFDTALAVADEAILAAEDSGHAYWLAELYRRRADLRSLAAGDPAGIAADLKQAMEIAERQGAAALAKRARRSAEELRVGLQP